MQNQKLLNKLFLILLGLCLTSLNLFAFATPPISRQALMKHIFAPTLFSMYSKDYGMLYCQLYGVAGVSKSFKNDTCEVSARAVKEMRHFAMQYTRNKVFLEQQYRLGYKSGWCFLQRGGNLFNAELVRDGYAVVQYFDITESAVLADLEVLESIAKAEKRGLWKEWGKEMECLKRTLQEIAKETLSGDSAE
ncbi:MAG: thermonuclease family protein [Helicobacter sp.]|uniref:thermonuclease family protein n=1 Tax=Helicobacter sp. TaxID=218 RepID=UPI0023BCDCFF|nr:thermonuclease family protein [Helicobacter sp.]MDE5925132.1 thermonuclease family protein [Helicobacter sp.]MDE7175054.1 thermonuclease family protein [Helicobacter sp.]